MKRLAYYLLAVLFVSCAKEKVPEPLTLKIHPDALRYLKYDGGKYYIYKDSATGRLDSVLLTDNSISTQYVSPYHDSWGTSVPAYTTQFIKILLHRFGDNVGTEWFRAEGRPELPLLLMGRYVSTDSASIILTEFIGWPDGGMSMNYGVFSSNQMPVAMTVEGVNYPNVIIDILSSPSYYANSLRVHYWAKDVGIVKRIITLQNVRYVSTLLRHGRN